MGEGEDRLYWSEVDGAGAGEAFELEEAGARIDVGEVDGREGGACDEDGEDAGVRQVACGLVDGADAGVQRDAVEGEGIVVEDEYESSRKKLSHRLGRFDVLFGVTQASSLTEFQMSKEKHSLINYEE